MRIYPNALLNANTSKVVFAPITTSTTLANSVVESYMGLFTVPANTLSSDGMTLLYKTSCNLLNNTGSSQQWSFGFFNNHGGVSVEWFDTTSALSQSATSRFCTIEALITRVSNTTYIMRGTILIGITNTATTGLGDISLTSSVSPIGTNGVRTIGGGNTFSNNDGQWTFYVQNGATSPSMSHTTLGATLDLL